MARGIFTFGALGRVAIASAALALATGCAGMRAEEARRGSVESQVKDYKYQKPIEQVWPQARQLIFERGYTPQGGSEAGWTLETAWKDTTTQVLLPKAERILLKGLKDGEGKCSVVMTKQTKTDSPSPGSIASSRDYFLELELLKRVDPEKGKAVEAEAAAAAEKARGT